MKEYLITPNTNTSKPSNFQDRFLSLLKSNQLSLPVDQVASFLKNFPAIGSYGDSEIQPKEISPPLTSITLKDEMELKHGIIELLTNAGFISSNASEYDYLTVNRHIEKLVEAVKDTLIFDTIHRYLPSPQYDYTKLREKALELNDFHAIIDLIHTTLTNITSEDLVDQYLSKLGLYHTNSPEWGHGGPQFVIKAKQRSIRFTGIYQYHIPSEFEKIAFLFHTLLHIDIKLPEQFTLSAKYVNLPIDYVPCGPNIVMKYFANGETLEIKALPKSKYDFLPLYRAFEQKYHRYGNKLMAFEYPKSMPSVRKITQGKKTAKKG